MTIIIDCSIITQISKKFEVNVMDFTDLKNQMDKIVNEYKVPGIDCILYKDHEMLFRYYTGMSDIENNKKMNGNELYFIFSMTKMLTCTSALQLYEKGKFLMTDPISKYMPEFETMKVKSDDSDTGYVTAKNPITVKDLFTMSAGFDYDLNAPYFKKAIAENKTSTRELVGALSEAVLGFEPGTNFRYSLCHDVLGALIEIWSGIKLGEYMKENLFEPLGMKETFFGLPKNEEQLSKMAARYTFDRNKSDLPLRLQLLCLYNLSDEYQSGGAGLVSCAEDYSLFLDAIACGGVAKNGNRILSPATVELMGMNHLKGKQLAEFEIGRPGYGYGLGVRTHIDKSESNSLTPIGEFGWDGAASAFSLVDPKNNISFSYFQHVHNSECMKIQYETKNVLYACLEK